ncbi:UPF0562 protein C7orf55-like protein [Dinothrombium tinctorium]|uniref:Protein FMC1 homolog n=1 Tax=Dinothrombium tinctorium TaxID=1965070 RepID=A0A3S4QYC0_9ACAR|nr:UPF0562 protein C7orf55-like protein [Dinothrombium tinctorium]RWS09229.1 UPF0562 protein C7orf55-like protein [Dinothrombium tinctorium]
MEASKAVISVLRNISKELRKSTLQRAVNNVTLRHVLNEYRKYETTEQRTCRAKQEMQFLAQTYHCYLNSSRLYRELHNRYYGKGERGVEETARLLGFEIRKK